jgi:putative two-component system response regulator
MDAPRILIIEDSRSIRGILANKLKAFGAEVTTAEDGQKGLDKIQQQTFDLVLSDVEMPVMNGLELCKALKNQAKTQRIPVVLISSMERDEDIDRGFEAGASAYILKSSPDDLLLRTIEETLEKVRFKRDRTVMIVDDSQTVLKLVKNGLAQAGYRVLTATDGRKALELLTTHLPDIIISDLDMPEMNGFEFRENLRTDSTFASIPFIVMSANSDRASMRKMVERGAAGYIVKPFNMEQLIITTEKILSDQFLLLLKDRERLEAERNAMLSSITSLAQALEARDPYTRGHSENVSEIVVGMGNLLDLSSAELETLKIGAKLHDIGKIGIPDSLLLKNGPLSPMEVKIFQQHPSIGTDILSPIASLADMVPVVLHHHERFDGNGYPSGLKGEGIPLWSRMTAVADTYDALTTDRPYRKGFALEKALDIITEVRGTQLCPKCYDVFMQWISERPSEPSL